MNEGWIALHRKALDSPVYSDERAWRLFTTCLLKANWSTGFFQREEIRRGQFATSVRSLASLLGWSPATVHRTLDKLIELECIEVEVKHRFSVVTICNYETYQEQDQEHETQMKRKRNADETQMKHIEQEQQEQQQQQAAAGVVDPSENFLPVDLDANPYAEPLTPEQESRRDQIHAKLCEVLGESEFDQFWIDVATFAATDGIALRVTRELVAAIQKSKMDNPAGFFRSRFPQYLGNARRRRA